MEGIGIVTEEPIVYAVEAAACEFRLTADAWPYGTHRADEINAAWMERLAQSPHFWNGAVHLAKASTVELRDGRLSGHMWATDFKSFAHWKEKGRPEADAFDCFGSIILRSAEGHIVLGLQGKGLSKGQVYLPSGVIDDADVAAGGVVDIETNIARELNEETGLSTSELTRVPGYLVVRYGNLLSIGAIFRAPLKADELRRRILGHIARDPDPELADIIIAATPADLERPDIQPYSAIAVTHLLDKL